MRRASWVFCLIRAESIVPELDEGLMSVRQSAAPLQPDPVASRVAIALKANESSAIPPVVPAKASKPRLWLKPRMDRAYSKETRLSHEVFVI
jgi:hypothetical protein